MLIREDYFHKKLKRSLQDTTVIFNRSTAAKIGFTKARVLIVIRLRFKLQRQQAPGFNRKAQPRLQPWKKIATTVACGSFWKFSAARKAPYLRKQREAASTKPVRLDAVATFVKSRTVEKKVQVLATFRELYSWIMFNQNVRFLTLKRLQPGWRQWVWP